uniref:Transposase n=1 Tax=Ascaris lumbricoides TaxID=6252 RepID=A0A0M3IP83_ASCLU
MKEPSNVLGIDEEAFRFEKVPHFSRKNKLRNEIVSGHPADGNDPEAFRSPSKCYTTELSGRISVAIIFCIDLVSLGGSVMLHA